MTKLTPSPDYATRPIELPVAAGRACAEHGWETASRHATSLGTVVYSACASCGAHRTELRTAHMLFPEPISREIARD